MLAHASEGLLCLCCLKGSHSVLQGMATPPSHTHQVDVHPSSHDQVELLAVDSTQDNISKQPASGTGGDVQEKSRAKRVACLDAFRGLTVLIMILVDDSGGYWPRINHSPWNGVTLADIVMPFFLFIVGFAIALALKKIPDKRAAVQKVVVRTGKLFIWGLLLQGGYSHAPELGYGVDMRHIRWMGILQRIAISYLVVAMIEIATTRSGKSPMLKKGPLATFNLYKYHWFAAALILVLYLGLEYGLYVPDWHFHTTQEDGLPGPRLDVHCGVRGHVGPACNAVGHVDRAILGINHLYTLPEWTRSKACSLGSPGEGEPPPDAPTWCQAPFEPEGILSSMSAILSCLLGIHYGHILIHYEGHVQRLKHWLLPGAALISFGTILHFSHAVPINKQLYSVSYVAFTGGAAGLLFSALYILNDVYGIRKPTIWLEWVGMNAMLVFVLGAQQILEGFTRGFYVREPGNDLVRWIQKHVFVKPAGSIRVGMLLYVLFGEILFWSLLSGFLHWKRWYWKL